MRCSPPAATNSSAVPSARHPGEQRAQGFTGSSGRAPPGTAHTRCSRCGSSACACATGSPALPAAARCAASLGAPAPLQRRAPPTAAAATPACALPAASPPAARRTAPGFMAACLHDVLCEEHSCGVRRRCNSCRSQARAQLGVCIAGLRRTLPTAGRNQCVRQTGTVRQAWHSSAQARGA